MTAIVKKRSLAKHDKVTLIGNITLQDTKWDIPLEHQPVNNLDSNDRGLLFVTTSEGVVALDRSGINVGISVSVLDELLENLAIQFKAEIQDVQIFPIYSGEGLHYSCYGKEDGSTIARFIKSNPDMLDSYKVFVSKLKE